MRGMVVAVAAGALLAGLGPVDAAAAATSLRAAGMASSISLDVSAGEVRSGATVTLTAHLDTDSADRTVHIFAKPSGQTRQLVDEGVVDASGDFQTTADVDRRTTFIARFDGDSTYDPAEASQVVEVVARLADQLTGYYDTSHGFRLYHVGDDAHVDAYLQPELEAVCLYFRAQRRQAGDWRTTAVSRCVRTDAAGRASSKLRGYRALVDKPYRVRAEWRGNRAAGADKGPWLKLRFRG